MKYTEVIKIEEKTHEKRIFDLECHVSMLQEFVLQLTMDTEWVALIEEAKALGLTVEEIRDWLAQNSEK